MNDTAVFSFARMNPITTGHKKLVSKILSITGDHFLFLSHTHNKKTDPLDFNTKMQFAKEFFPSITVGSNDVKTVIQALQKLHAHGYKHVVFVAGSDRVENFNTLLHKYNGIEYQFETINIVSAGERDPDSSGLSGISATKMRVAALNGDIVTFTKHTPDVKLADKMYKAVRNGFGVS